MYSYIEASKFTEFYDEHSAAMIGYMKSGGSWNAPKAGTWVSWLNEKSIDAYCKYAT